MLVLYSFHTGQTRVVLSMTAVASLSSLVQKPSSKVHFLLVLSLGNCFWLSLRYWGLVHCWLLLIRYFQIKAWKLDCLGLLAKGSFLQRCHHQCWLLIGDVWSHLYYNHQCSAEFSLLKFNVSTLFQVRWPVIPHMKLISQSQLRGMSQLNLCLQRYVVNDTNSPRKFRFYYYSSCSLYVFN